MDRKTITVVGMLFHKEDAYTILEYLKNKNLLSRDEKIELNNRLDRGEGISHIYEDIMTNKKINNYPIIEVIDPDMSEEYFLGYRIKEEAIEIPTNAKVLNQIKEAQNEWLKIFGEIPLVESVSFDLY